MTEVVVSNNLVVMNPTDRMWQWAYENLMINNPEYAKKLHMGKWVGNTPEYIRLYEKNGDNLILPFGCCEKFFSTFSKEITFKLQFHGKFDAEYKSDISLYDYQKRAVKAALERKNGIVVMPCGSGKTQTALQILCELGGRVLWLTHTQDLLQQSMTRAKSVLNTSASYGAITGGKVDIGTGITFATVQTMCKINLSAHKDDWDIVIVDECQHCCGSPTRVTQFYKVVSSLNARYKFGLTATPKRSDGLHKSMFALLGEIIHTTTREEVKHTTCPIHIQTIETQYEPDYNAVLMADGTLNYSELLNDLVQNEDRYQQVLGVINSLNGSVLVLASRVSYIQDLCEAYQGRAVCLSTLGQSQKAKAERKEALRKLNDGELDAIFATYQLAKEGLDVPNLKYVVFATPEKDETTIIQSAGRVGRKADGKEFGTVIDFVDDFGMYRRWAGKRQGYYKKIDAIY